MKSLFMRKLNCLLKTQTFGKVIYYHEEIASTNTLLFNLAQNGASEGTVIIADKQTDGRGRLNRKWVSPPGVNLYISVLLRPKVNAQESHVVTFLAAIALMETIKKTGISTVETKWPNDLRINRKKVAGILTQMRMNKEAIDFIVVGIGVNINMSRELINSEMGGVANLATSLRENLGRDIDRSEFSADLMLELEKWYQMFNQLGINAIISEWAKRWEGKNQRVRVDIDTREPFVGTAINIDERGRLIVKKDNGELVKVIAGDVSVI